MQDRLRYYIYSLNIFSLLYLYLHSFYIYFYIVNINMNINCEYKCEYKFIFTIFIVYLFFIYFIFILYLFLQLFIFIFYLFLQLFIFANCHLYWSHCNYLCNPSRWLLEGTKIVKNACVNLIRFYSNYK